MIKIHNFGFNLSKMSLQVLSGSTCSYFLDSGSHDLMHTVFTSFFCQIKVSVNHLTMKIWIKKTIFRFHRNAFHFWEKISNKNRETSLANTRPVSHNFTTHCCHKFFPRQINEFFRQIKVSVINLTVKIWSLMTKPRI